MCRSRLHFPREMEKKDYPDAILMKCEIICLITYTYTLLWHSYAPTYAYVEFAYIFIHEKEKKNYPNAILMKLELICFPR
jgi:hypothetical protein